MKYSDPMKKIYLLFIFLLAGMCCFGQSSTRYKIRTFGLGFYGNIGFGYPLDVETVGSEDQIIKPAYRFFNDVSEITEDFEGRTLDPVRETYSLGAFVHYKHSIGTKLLLTLQGGYATSQVSHYLVNALPTQGNPYAGWVEWYNYQHYFYGAQIGIGFGKTMRRYANFGCRVSQTSLVEPLFVQNVTGYQGITKSDTRTWNNSEGGFSIVDEVNTDVTVLTPSFTFLFQFGKYNSHAFEIGMSYSFALDQNLITSTYTRREGFDVTGQSIFNFKGQAFALEASYTIPIFRSKKKYVKKIKPPKPITPPKSPRKKKPRNTKPTPRPTISEDPIVAAIRPKISSCFGTNPDESTVKYVENHFKFNNNIIEFDLYHKDGLADGDEVSVCVDGQLLLRNVILSEAGTRFKVDTRGKREIDIIIYTVKRGSTDKVSIGLSVISGGQDNTVEKNAEENHYYLYKVERQ